MAVGVEVQTGQAETLPASGEASRVREVGMGILALVTVQLLTSG